MDRTYNKSHLLPGSIVKLVSGSPDMTIVSITVSTVECKWFDELDQLHTAEYDMRCVEGVRVDRKTFARCEAMDHYRCQLEAKGMGVREVAEAVTNRFH